MIENQRVLGLITARGGSKGVPGKNIRRVRDKPLIGWSIDAARGSRYLDRLILSSDDERIIEVARSCGCEVPFQREARLAADNTPSIDVVLDALERCPGFEWVVLLQPTSPLRNAADIDGTIEACIRAQAPACVTVAEAEQSPYWMFNRRADSRLVPVVGSWPLPERRQDLPAVYALNGAVYVARTGWLVSTRSFLTDQTAAYPMPQSRSLDIDTELDFAIFETLAERAEHV